MRPFIAACIFTLALQAQPAPDAAALQDLVARVQASARRFDGQLPDFRCTKLTERWEASGPGKKFKKNDSLQESVAFAATGRTSITLVARNGKPTDDPQRLRLRGLVEDSLLAGALVPRHLFDLAAEPRFEWGRWETRDGRTLAILRYRAKSENYPDGKTRYELALTGEIHFDLALNQIVGLNTEAQGPPGYPMGDSGWELEFAPVSLSGLELILPVRGSIHATLGKKVHRNDLQFVDYRKFGADSSIQFDTVEQ